jgi:hypothetical protein
MPFRWPGPTPISPAPQGASSAPPATIRALTEETTNLAQGECCNACGRHQSVVPVHPVGVLILCNDPKDCRLAAQRSGTWKT